MSSFVVELCFSGTIRARVMKLGTSLHLVEGNWMHPWKLGHDLYFTHHWLNIFMSSLLVKLCFSGTIKARVLKLGTFIHLVEGSWMHPWKLGHDLYFMLHWLNKFMLSFLVKLCFSGTKRARVMKLGTSIHLVEEGECIQNNKVMTYFSLLTNLTNLCWVSLLSSVSQELWET